MESLSYCPPPPGKKNMAPYLRKRKRRTMSLVTNPRSRLPPFKFENAALPISFFFFIHSSILSLIFLWLLLLHNSRSFLIFVLLSDRGGGARRGGDGSLGRFISHLGLRDRTLVIVVVVVAFLAFGDGFAVVVDLGLGRGAGAFGFGSGSGGCFSSSGGCRVIVVIVGVSGTTGRFGVVLELVEVLADGGGGAADFGGEGGVVGFGGGVEEDLEEEGFVFGFCRGWQRG